MWTKPVQGGTAAPSTAIDSIYTIELPRWGITKGLPTKRFETIGGVDVKCYSDAAYLTAHNNSIGINNALDWAYTNGYRTVIMPVGSYSVSYSNISDNAKENRIVMDYDNFTFDLNNSTFKVMYDSGKRSPYDMVRSNTGVYTVSTTAPYEFCGVIFMIRDCDYTTLKNGTIIGDKIDRDFLVAAERNVQSSEGVTAGGNGRYITVDNMDISFFMGEGTSTSFGSNQYVATGYAMGWQVGDLDANGLVVASTTRCTSNYVAVQATTPYFIKGLGYTQGFTGLKNKKHATYCYNANKAFIGRLPDSYVLRGFTTIKDTAFIRFVVEEYAVASDGWTLFLYKGLHGDFTTFSNNYIHHCHRGGHAGALNDTLFLNNHFYNNGEQTDFEYGLPGFETGGVPEPTRFHIDVEDISGYNQRYIGNKFQGGRLGIATRGHDCVIKDNVFINCTGVILYRMHHAVVRDNYFDNASFDSYPYSPTWTDLQDYVRHWYIDGNTFDGTFNVRGTAIVHSISNNIFKNMVGIESKVDIFSKNTFIIDKDFSYSEYFIFKTIDTIEHCVFKKSSLSPALNSFTVWNAFMVNCSFQNLKVNVQDVILESCIINDSGFNIATGSFKAKDCKFTYGTYLLKNNYAQPDNSAMISVVSPTNPVKLEFTDCDIKSAHSHGLFSSYLAQATQASLKLQNTKITRTAFSKMGFALLTGAFDFSNTVITSELAAGNFVPNAASNHKFIDCTFTNLSFTVRGSDVLYTQQDVNILARPLAGNGTPQTIPQKIGQEYYDTTGKRLYKAFGTTAIADWIVMN